MILVHVWIIPLLKKINTFPKRCNNSSKNMMLFFILFSTRVTKTVLIFSFVLLKSCALHDVSFINTLLQIERF